MLGGVLHAGVAANESHFGRRHMAGHACMHARGRASVLGSITVKKRHGWTCTSAITDEVDSGLLQRHSSMATGAEAQRLQGHAEEAHQHLKLHGLMVVCEADCQLLYTCCSRQRPRHKACQPGALL